MGVRQVVADAPRIVAIAVAPRGRLGSRVADQLRAVRSVLLLDRDRAVAAEVARIRPELLVLVEVLRRVEIDGERLRARGHLAVARRADERAVLDRCRALGRIETDRNGRAGDLVLVDVGTERRGAPDALEVDFRDLLRVGGSANQDRRRERKHVANQLAHVFFTLRTRVAGLVQARAAARTRDTNLKRRGARVPPNGWLFAPIPAPSLTWSFSAAEWFRRTAATFAVRSLRRAHSRDPARAGRRTRSGARASAA